MTPPKDIGAASYEVITEKQQEREAASRRKTVVTVANWAFYHRVKPLTFIEMIDALELRAELDEMLGDKKAVADELWAQYEELRDSTDVTAE